MAEYPHDLKYTVEHEWVKRHRRPATAGARRARRDHRLRPGRARRHRLRLAARRRHEVDAGDALGEVESTKSVSDVYAPLAGEVVARNEELEQHPGTDQFRPYGSGWLVEIRVSDPSALDGLLDAAGLRLSRRRPLTCPAVHTVACGQARAAGWACTARSDPQRSRSTEGSRGRRVLYSVRAAESAGRTLLRPLRPRAAAPGRPGQR